MPGHWWTVGAGLAVLLAVRIAFRDAIVGEVAYVTATIAGAVLAWRGARGAPAQHRTTWRIMAVGLAMSAAADVIYSGSLLLAGDVPGVSPADVGWLGCYVLIAVAVFRLAQDTRAVRGFDVDALLDAAAVGIVALVVVWYASISEIVGDTSTPTAVRAVWASYPILDAALLALGVRLLLSDGSRRSSQLVVAGLALWLLADFCYVLWAGAGSFSVVLDIAWMTAPVLVGTGAWAPRRARARGAPAEPGHVGSVRLALLTLPILLPSIVDVWGHAGGIDHAPLLLLAVTAVLALLIYLRARRLLTASTRARSALRASQRHFAALAANASDAAFVVDSGGRPLTGGGVPEAAGTAGGLGTDGLHRWARAAADGGLLDRACSTPAVSVSEELSVTDADGRVRWMLARATDLTADPDVRGIVLNLHDITDRKAVEEALAHRALHDVLTGLPNRVLLRDRIEQALQRTARSGRDVAVAYLDLDSFKRINDSLGHDAGDDLLSHVAERLTATVRPADTVARLGGDEFAVLIEDAGDDAAAEIADRIVEALREPLQIGDRQVVGSASVGLSVSDPDASAMSLLRDADVAMYRAKATGGNQWVRYEPEMRTFIDEQLRLEIDLVAALEHGQLELRYQPVVRLDTDQFVGFEALLRWQHPSLGMIAPDRFIPIAERTGLIVPIGRWVLETACATLARWHAGGQRDLTMAVNVSGRQLASDEFVGHVAAALDASGVSPDHLVLEMTESVLIEDVAQASARLHELREVGVRLAIDDFGTGYSSLGYLRQFPVDILKIDRSFVNTIDDAGTDIPPIVRGLLDLAGTLRLETVAEGIELEVQHDRLRANRCEMGQGYLFARPMERAEADQLVASLTASAGIDHAPAG